MGSLPPALIQAKLWLYAPWPGRPLSISTTLTPRRARRQAMAAPTMPAPITAALWGLLGMSIGYVSIHRGGNCFEGG